MEVKRLPVFISRLIFLCVLVNVNFVDCSATQKVSTESESENLKWAETSVAFKSPTGELKSERIPDDFQKKRLTKREIYETEGHIKCLEEEAPGGTGVKMIREIKQHEYAFSLKLQADFQKLIFHMMIDNTFNHHDPYQYGEDLIFHKDDFKDDNAKQDTWLEVKVKYYKQVVRFSPDKLALRVTVGNLTRQLITGRWWRTHKYEGFRISTEGGAHFRFDCVARSRVNASVNQPVSGVNQPLILGGVLGACFLLVIIAWLGFMIIRRHPPQSSSDHPPSVPPLPASLLLGSNKVNKCPDVNHIYEEFDEDTLARLRQKMNPKTLGECGKAKCLAEEGEPRYDVPLRKHLKNVTSSSVGRKQSGGTDPIYSNQAIISLVEEKIKLSGRDSAPETHYIEMHGIIRPSLDEEDETVASSSSSTCSSSFTSP